MTSGVFPYYSDICFHEMRTLTCPALPVRPAAHVCAWAQFPQPGRGSLWQLITPAFMHIHECVSSEEKGFRPGPGRGTSDRESQNDIPRCIHFSIAAVMNHHRLCGLEYRFIVLHSWKSEMSHGSHWVEIKGAAELQGWISFLPLLQLLETSLWSLRVRSPTFQNRKWGTESSLPSGSVWPCSRRRVSTFQDACH